MHHLKWGKNCFLKLLFEIYNVCVCVCVCVLSGDVKCLFYCDLESNRLDFPGGPGVKNPPVNAGDMDLIPGPGRSPMLCSNWACKPQLLKPECPRAPVLQQEKSPQWEAHTPQLDSSPHSLKLEKTYVQQQRPTATKTNKF